MNATLVTIPFGIASFRIAGYALRPFGRTVVDRPDAGAWSVLGVANLRLVPVSLMPLGKQIVPTRGYAYA